MKKLGDYADFIMGQAPSSKDCNLNGIGTPFVKAGQFGEYEPIIDEWTTNPLKLARKDDILICVVGATSGKLNRGIECAIGRSVAAIRPNKNIRRDYIYYGLHPWIFRLRNSSQGSAIGVITKDMLADIEMPFPSVDEQDKIIGVLYSIENVIQSRKQELQKLDELIKARFIELFGNAANKIPVSELCDVTGGYSFKSGDISSDGEIKILQIGNVYLNDVNWDITNYLPEGYDEKYSKFLLDEGDIVVALTRPIIQSLGNVKACVVKASDLPCLLNQRVGRIVPKEDRRVVREFIYGCLMTDDFTRYVESCSIGCSQPNISTKDIENYLIPSVPYEKQMEYVEFKKQTDKSKIVVQKALDEVQLLFDSLMQKYFG